MFHVEQYLLTPIKSCPICNGTAFRDSLSATDNTVSKATFALVDCAHCGFRATSPRPSEQDIGQFYRSNAYISHTDSRASLVDKIYQLVRKRALQSKRASIAKHVPQGNLLDIGCGTGAFLGHMKHHGYVVEGVEPDTDARARAIEQESIPVSPSLDGIPAREQYHAITLWHSLEHVHAPQLTARKIHARLKPGGWIFIAVPDRGSWDAAYYGSGWAAYDVPRHLSHFRKQDLRRLLEQQGFEQVHTKRMWFDAPYVAMLSEQHKGRSALFALLLGSLVGMISNFIAVFSKRSTSSTFYIAKKPKS